jgi:hypothetical protein
MGYGTQLLKTDTEQSNPINDITRNFSPHGALSLIFLLLITRVVDLDPVGSGTFETGRNNYTSVADPGSGTFLTPGSGIRDR